MGIRLLFVIAALLLVVLIVRQLLRKNINQEKREGTTQGTDMVQCAHCGLHTPKPEAVFDAPNYYCCEEHRRLG